MKRTILVAVMIMALTLSACSATGKAVSEAKQVTAGDVREATLSIEGMSCTSCALGVAYQLKQVEGVLDAEVNYEEGKAYVSYDADLVDAETIAAASDVYPAAVDTAAANTAVGNTAAADTVVDTEAR